MTLTHSPIKHLSDGEYTPMTMQVALMGKASNIVIASDRRSQVQPLIEGAARHTTERVKIKVAPSRRIAVSSAIDLDTADEIADRIIAEMDDQTRDNRDTRILAIANRIVGNRSVECIAAFLDPEPSLYFLECKGDNHKTCSIRFLHAYAGDRVNAAVYWNEMYHQTEDLSVEQMCRLSAHVIATAAQLNPKDISGLDIVRSEVDGFHFLPKAELDALKEASQNHNREFGAAVLGN